MVYCPHTVLQRPGFAIDFKYLKHQKSIPKFVKWSTALTQFFKNLGLLWIKSPYIMRNIKCHGKFDLKQ
jgi:hypothetical protein